MNLRTSAVLAFVMLAVAGPLAVILTDHVTAAAPAPRVAPPAESLSPAQAFERLAAWDYDQPRQALSVLELHIVRCASDPAQRQQAAERLAAVLADPKATEAAKAFVCRQLPFVAGNAQVPVLAKMLDDAKMADAARRALAGIPGEASLEALRAAVSRLKGDALVGVINSLGDRGDAKAAPALAGLVSGESPTAFAAAAALGRIGTVEACEALAKAEAAAGEKLRPAVREALLVAASRRLRAGDAAAAAGICRKLLEGKPSESLRLAALGGLVRAAREKALPEVAAAIGSDDTELQAAAMRMTAEMPGAEVTAALVQQLDRLTPPAQAILIDVLAQRSDRTASAAVTKRLDDSDEAVRAAAARAMTTLGDASSVARLASLAAAEKGAVAAAARAALARMSGADMDAHILSAAKQGDPAARAELLRALAARRTPGAAATLLQAAAAPEEPVRVAALEALAVLGRAEDYPKLVALLAAARGAADTEAAEKAVVAVGAGLGSAADRSKPVLAALESAPAEARPGLLRVLAACGGAEALQAVRSRLKDANAETGDAAVKALANWPDAAAADDLLTLIKAAEKPAHRVLALRGYLRLAREAKDDAVRVKMLEQVRPLTTTADGKRMLLASLADAADAAALDMALAYLADADVKAEAALAAQKIAKALAATDRKALRTVLATWQGAKKPGAEEAAALLEGILKSPAAARQAGAAASPVTPLAPAVREAVLAGLRERTPKGYRVACYLDCGPEAADGQKGGPELRLASGQAHAWAAGDPAQARLATVAFDGKEVAFAAAGLNPKKTYLVGFTWWDYDHDTRAESVWAAPAQGGQPVKVVDKTPLPSGTAGKSAEQKAFAVPPALVAGGGVRILFRNEGQANAVVSEVWLWESEADGAAVPAGLDKPAAVAAGPAPAAPAAAAPAVSAMPGDLKLTRAAPEAGRTTRILIVTGLEHHKWRETLPVVVEFLKKDSRLLVDVSEEPAVMASPMIHEYAAIVLHYMNPKGAPTLDVKARENLRQFVEGGKGLMLIHFACGAFQEWPEFRDVVGRVWDPKMRPHDPRGPFRVEFTGKHAITEGLAAIEADDELYTCLTGDRPIEVLATATSKVDSKVYPMAFTYAAGKGRVFQCLLGHDAKAMRQPGVDELYRRGTAWAAGLTPVK